MANEYGLDFRYFERKLSTMGDFSRYTPAELYRELTRMAEVARNQNYTAYKNGKPLSEEVCGR